MERLSPGRPPSADVKGLLDRLVAAVEPEPTVVTLTLDVAGSGVLPEPARVFLKDRAFESLAPEPISSGARRELQSLSARVRRFVDSELRPGVRGLFLVAGTSLWEPVELMVAVPNSLYLDRVPYLAPLLAAVERAPRALVATCDERGVALRELILGHWSEAGHWAPLEVERDAERIISGRTPVRLSGTTRGRAGIGGGKRDRFERSLQAEGARVLAAVARRVTALSVGSPPAAIYVLGDPERFREFRSHLPSDLRESAEPLGPAPRTDPELRRLAEQSLARKVAARRAGEVAGFLERRKQGHLVALGPADVLAHHTSGRLARVFLDPEDPVPGLRCVACAALHPAGLLFCGYCNGTTRPVSLTQEIVALSWTHPPLPITFVDRPARWLEELGGMAGLVARKGIRGKR